MHSSSHPSAHQSICSFIDSCICLFIYSFIHYFIHISINPFSYIYFCRSRASILGPIVLYSPCLEGHFLSNMWCSRVHDIAFISSSLAHPVIYDFLLSPFPGRPIGGLDFGWDLAACALSGAIPSCPHTWFIG